MEALGVLALPAIGLMIFAVIGYAGWHAYTNKAEIPKTPPAPPKPPKIQTYRFRHEKRK